MNIDVGFRIRFNPIEEFKAKIDKDFDVREKASVFYTFFELAANFFENIYRNVPFRVETENDLEKAIQSFKQIMNEKGFTFFERFHPSQTMTTGLIKMY